MKLYIDKIKKMEEETNETAIEKAVAKAFEPINNHFVRAPFEGKSGVVIELYDQVIKLQKNFEVGGIIPEMQPDISTLKGDVSILKAHFETGGLIPKLSDKIDTLEGHFEEGGIINQILNEIKASRKENAPENTPNKRREKSR